MHTKLLLVSLKEIGTQKDLGIDGRKILNGLSVLAFGCVDQIHLAQNRDRWRALVNVMLDILVP
jgi:hypothetical protein